MLVLLQFWALPTKFSFCAIAQFRGWVVWLHQQVCPPAYSPLAPPGRWSCLRACLLLTLRWGMPSLALPPSMPTWHFGASGPAARAPGPTEHYTGTPGPSPRGPASTNTLMASWTYLRPHLAEEPPAPGLPASSEHYTHRPHPQPVHYLLHPIHKKCFKKLSTISTNRITTSMCKFT